MKELRTTLYDLRGYFIPGSIMLWAMLELLDLTGYVPGTRVLSTLSPTTQGVLFVIIAYAVGHGLHSIANFTIDKLPFASYPPKNYFDGKFQKDFSPDTTASLARAITGLLGNQPNDSSSYTDVVKGAYWLCFQYVMNCQNIETENFLGLTGFYRGMTAAMLVTSFMYSVAFAVHCKGQLGIIAIFSFAIGVLFLARAQRFSYYLARTVYSTFLHLYQVKNQNTSL